MTRLRLFLFYSLMAWASLLKPAEGAVMIDDAEAGALQRQRKALNRPDIELSPGCARIRGPSGSTVALAAAVAIMVTGGWLALIINAGIDWFTSK